ncbi:MAG: DNA recombination protein RmuC [Bacteroidales bacterium]|jgi:DNA recombination protein RmuC|nr:DNA recombination protein RmuC [Bacteroidales bacterium]
MIEILLVALIILVIVNIIIGFKKKISIDIKPQLREIEASILKFDSTLERTEKSIKDEFQRNRKETNEISKTNRDELATTLNAFGEQFSKNVKDLNDLLREKFGDFNKQQTDINKQATENIKGVESTIAKHLKAIREDNTQQLNEMRKTVDEKLQTTLEKRLGESFKQVSDRLEQVHKGLGEMQNIATGVGDLKKVLTNVKTRGVLGEYQLENILEQILTPDQYSKNVATKKGSQANVEFALKLPGKESGEEVWMPIDSKFPIEDYHVLIDAFEKGDKIEIEIAQKGLIKKIESFAKSISEKYIDPPHTTDFGIMFLPIESLYAEVLRHPGLFEILQTKYKITVTGPTTLSALLSSLQMGFRTLAVQKRSSEVWDILKAVKYEFQEFSGVLAKAHKQINTASGTLESLRSTRTNAIQRKLKDVETFTKIESKEILELPDIDMREDSIED